MYQRHGDNADNKCTDIATFRVSAIIVTYRRPKELYNCIELLLKQSVPLCEIIIIDNGGGVDDLVKDISLKIPSKIPIKYFTNKINSLTSARNMGVRKAEGDFIILIDDDVIIEQDYLEILLHLFIQKPDAVGAQGHIKYDKRPGWREFFHRVFGLYHHQPNRCEVLSTGNTIYPKPLTKTISCQWISGCNQVYKRHVLQEIQWDEKMIKYSDGEDLDHSFRVYQKYPNRLFITPEASVIHEESQESRTIGYELIAMREVYGWYLFNKLFPKSRIAIIAFLWSRLGRFLLALGADVANTRRWSQMTSKLLLKAYWLVWRDRDKIKKGNLDKFNSILT